MMGSSFARHAAELLPFCRERGYNDRVALLWDLSRHSGRRRLAVWNFRKGCAEHVFVASHGSGSAESHVRSAYARVSNEDGSHLSSEGRALVAERYTGSYGVAYRLDGLDETNVSLRPRSCCTGGVIRPIFPSGLWRRSAVGAVPSCRRATWRRWMPFCNANRG